MAALHHGVDGKAGNDHADEHIGEVGILGDVLQALGTVEQLEAQHIIDVVQGDADDLAKAQRQDGQIITGQAQSRNADQHAEQARHDAGQHQTHDKSDTGGQIAVFREQGAGVSTHGHETGVAQRQLAQITGGNVQRDSQNDVDAHGEKHLVLVGGQHVLGEEGQAHEQQSHQHGVHQVAHGHFERFAFGIHLHALLTPFPEPCGQGSRWA